MEERDVPFHAHQLREERHLKIVTKEIPTNFTEDIKKKLSEMQYPAIKITQMNGHKGAPAPMVIIKIKQKYKSLYSAKQIWDLKYRWNPLGKMKLFSATDARSTVMYKGTVLPNIAA